MAYPNQAVPRTPAVNEDPTNSAHGAPSDTAAQGHECAHATARSVSAESGVNSDALSTGTDKTAIPQKGSGQNLPIILAAWLVPGAGHLLLARRMRGLGIFVAVAGLALTGYALRGNVFVYHPGDAFALLGFLADAGSGVLYGLARLLEREGSDVSRAAGDYGTRFIAAAGIVNVLAILDAYEIARRRRT